MVTHDQGQAEPTFSSPTGALGLDLALVARCRPAQDSGQWGVLCDSRPKSPSLVRCTLHLHLHTRTCKMTVARNHG